MRKTILAVLILACLPLCAQQSQTDIVTRTRGNLPVARIVPGVAGQCLTTDVGGNTTWGSCAAGSGTVTTFSAGTLSPLFTTSVATATTTPALTFALSNAAAHTFFGNNTGSTAAPAFAAITAADLPGVFAQTLANAAHKWFNSYNAATGLFTQTQPDYSDLTGTPTLPATLANAAHKWFNSYNSATGLFTQTQPDYSDLTGVPSTFAAAAHNLLSATHGDTTAGTVATGDVISGQAGAWARLAGNTSTTPQYLKSLGSGAAANPPSWAQVAYTDLSGVPATFSPSAHNLLSAVHGDTTAAAAVRGDGIFAIGVTPTWQRLAHGATSGSYFKWNGTDVVASTNAAAGTGSCTNQVVTAENADAAPTCTTVTSAFTSGTFSPTAHNILSASHGDATAAAAVRGDGMFAIGATPTWQRLAHGATTGSYFKWNGTDIVASTNAASGTGSPTSCTNQFVTALTLNADAAPTSTCTSVTRASEGTDAKPWAFCGTATGATTTVGPVSASTCCSGGLCRQFIVMYQINGYNGGTPVGRLLTANGTISTTALTNSFSISENVTAPSTGSGGTAIPGLPLAVTLSAIGRSGQCFIDGASGSLKVIRCEGTEGTPSVATAPTLYRGASFFSDLGTNLALANFQLSVYDTLTATAVSAQAFTSGTYLAVWGRNTD